MNSRPMNSRPVVQTPVLLFKQVIIDVSFQLSVSPGTAPTSSLGLWINLSSFIAPLNFTFSIPSNTMRLSPQWTLTEPPTEWKYFPSDWGIELQNLWKWRIYGNGEFIGFMFKSCNLQYLVLLKSMVLSLSPASISFNNSISVMDSGKFVADLRPPKRLVPKSWSLQNWRPTLRNITREDLR